MKHFFYDNRAECLYIFDGDTSELKVLERLRAKVLSGLTDAEVAEEAREEGRQEELKKWIKEHMRTAKNGFLGNDQYDDGYNDALSDIRKMIV